MLGLIPLRFPRRVDTDTRKFPNTPARMTTALTDAHAPRTTKLMNSSSAAESLDPIAWFETWQEEMRASGEPEPAAMTLATANRDGSPSARVVLLKGIQEGDFLFFTHYGSRKACELAEQPQAALLFYWPKTYRQVRLEGRVERLAAADSNAYWATRARESQLSGATSPQSQPIPSREWLEEEVARNAAKFAGIPIPRPEDWGGFRFVPERIEFWQGKSHRLHERTRFTKNGFGWKREILAP